MKVRTSWRTHWRDHEVTQARDDPSLKPSVDRGEREAVTLRFILEREPVGLGNGQM